MNTVVLSGGQDSATTLAVAAATGPIAACVHFTYGQRHAIEHDSAQWWAAHYNAPLITLDLPALQQAAPSALTHAGDIAANHPNLRHLPASFVPGRNIAFLTLAAAVARNLNAPHLWTGVCQTDYSGYPDCRLDTIQSAQATLRLALDWPELTIHTPLMHLTKAATFALAHQHGVLDHVIERTHTCYEGDHSTRHPWGYGCGACPACVIRARGWGEYTASA